MIKRGFTLAEVLITLTIIGVVASITLPALMSNMQKNIVGVSLSKAFNTLSNANEMLLGTNGVSRISHAVTKSSSETDAAAYVRELKKYAKLHPFSYEKYPDYKTYQGNSYIEVPPISGYISDDGVLYYFHPTLQHPAAIVADEYTGDAYKVWVDINADSAPNTLGKDLFIFYIDDNGTVIPYGGAAWNGYRGRDSSDDPLWMDTETSYCYVDSVGKTKVGDGSACAGQIADSGWKVLYF